MTTDPRHDFQRTLAEMRQASTPNDLIGRKIGNWLATIVAEYQRVCAERDAEKRMHIVGKSFHDLVVSEKALLQSELAAERQRAEGLRTVLRDLVKWLDDHDWGYIPEPGESCIPFRAALEPKP